ncbi:RNA-directed DNA polymerase, eukaryota, reverse transcriptase zinc-binding domain protein [Tanacetum coccineum]
MTGWRSINGYYATGFCLQPRRDSDLSAELSCCDMPYLNISYLEVTSGVVRPPDYTFKILSLRDSVRSHVFKQMGDRCSTFFWHDKWWDKGPLCNLTVMRNIMVDDIVSKAKVAFMMGRHGWNWPTNIPKVDNMPCSVLDDSKKDVTLWITNEGRMVKYSTRRVWFDLSEKEDEVIWKGLVWYTHCIPKHAFILWLAINGRLATQDRVSKWYLERIMSCALCKKCLDSHRHLFFECNYTEKIWEVLKVKMGQNSLSHDWEEIVLTLCSLPCNKNILSITRRLVFRACVYYIWQEINIRLFSDEARDWKTLVNVIINEIRLKLSSLTVKESYQTSLIAERWKVQMNMKKDDETIIEEICCIPKDSLGSSFVLVSFKRKFPALVYEVFYVGLWRLLGEMPALMMPFLLPISSFCEDVAAVSEASLTRNVALCNKAHLNCEFSSFPDDALMNEFSHMDA